MTETGSTLAARSRPLPDGGHLDALDGVRAIAAFAVLTFHVAIESAAALRDGFFSSLLARGDIAVPIFFALSGLLLYRPYARAALTGEPRPDTRRYLIKRALRILPAYWLVVAVALTLWSREHLGDPATWLQLLFLAQTYELDPWWVGLGPKGLAQMWSLCVEAAFYLLLPLLAAGLAAFARRGGDDPGRRARRLLLGLAALAAVSPLWTILGHYPVYLPNLNSWLPRSLVFFALGMALAVVTVWAHADPDPANPARRLVRSVNSSPGTLWSVAALAYVVAASPVTGPRFTGVEGVWAGLFELVLYTITAAGLLAPAALLSRPGALVGRLLGNRAMRFLGRISYGVFLWQFVALYAWYQFTGQRPFTGNFPINLVAVATITIVLAVLTHRYVEEPARRLARPARRAPARPAAAAAESPPRTRTP
ncbi:acyltransferase [Thermopolyspora sp. NPDC052614]|uniref:acyltransferase family protein n=1 Tax=Thermopolyspora sp. NPDC052614 TaxID=3155682 RepID=UPI0034258836